MSSKNIFFMQPLASHTYIKSSENVDLNKKNCDETNKLTSDKTHVTHSDSLDFLPTLNINEGPNTSTLPEKLLLSERVNNASVS